MSRKLLELQCQKNLIDSTFEGYKLSLNEIPSTVRDLPIAVRKLQYNGDSFSFLSIALHSMYDHLITDPWHKTLLYFIDERINIVRVVVNPKNNTVEDFSEVLQIPEESSRVHQYNASVVFLGTETALAADGSGILHIINTGDRENCQNWTIEYSCEVLGENNSFTILDACYMVQNDSSRIHCLLTAIEEITNEESCTVPRASTALFWVELHKNSNRNWEVNEPFKITTAGVVKYGYFEPECKCLFIESAKPLKLSNDNEEPPQVIQKDPQYFWQQSSDDIKIWCTLPKSCSKEEVKIDVSGNHLNIVFKSDTFLSGETFQRLDTALTTWNITDNRKIKLLHSVQWQNLGRDSWKSADPDM